MQFLLRTHDGLTRFAFWLGASAVGGVAFCYCYEVAARYFFGAPSRWASDGAAYLLCASIFFAAPELVRNAQHVAITSFIERLGPRGAHRAAVAIAVTGAMTCATAAWICGTQAINQATQQIETLATIPIPKWWLMACITYGFADSAIHFLRAAFRARLAHGIEY